ncbi:MAG: hypothetical protein ACLFUZ_00995 [Candidatus Micrarchaeia archaeon]
MGENKPNLMNMKDEPKGRHPAGRHADRNSAGRHGKKLNANISEEGAQYSGRKLGAVARGATALFFAAGVNLGVSACTTGGGLKDTGPDAGKDTDTETITGDTDTGWDTDTGTAGPECGTGEADYEAVLGHNEKTLLGPVGHWMTIVDMSFSGQFAEVRFINEDFELVNTEGEVVEEGDISGYALLSLDGNPSITVTFGGEEQTITLCGVYRFADGVDAAHFTTDHEDGFMHCDYVDNGNLSVPEFSEVNASVVQRTREMIHTHGFIPDVDTGEDQECPGTEQEFVYESTSFVSPQDMNAPVSLSSIPSSELSFVELRGKEHLVLDIDAEQPMVEIVDDLNHGTLWVYESMTAGDLTVHFMGKGFGNLPEFAFQYPGIDEENQISVEQYGDKTLKIRIYDEQNQLVESFMLKYGDVVWDMLNYKVDAAVYREDDTMALSEGSTVKIGTKEYDVSIFTNEEGIKGWVLTPAEE